MRSQIKIANRWQNNFYNHPSTLSQLFKHCVTTLSKRCLTTLSKHSVTTFQLSKHSLTTLSKHCVTIWSKHSLRTSEWSFQKFRLKHCVTTLSKHRVTILQALSDNYIQAFSQYDPSTLSQLQNNPFLNSDVAGAWGEVYKGSDNKQRGGVQLSSILSGLFWDFKTKTLTNNPTIWLPWNLTNLQYWSLERIALPIWLQQRLTKKGGKFFNCSTPNLVIYCNRLFSC